MREHLAALLWAHWRSGLNRLRHNKVGPAFSLLFMAIWYGLWAAFAVLLGVATADPDNLDLAERYAAPGLLALTLYWQLAPLLTGSTGLALDLRTLRAYPIPPQSLFVLESLLRLTANVEAMLALLGFGMGLLFNPALPFWSPFGLLLLGFCNLLLATALRDSLGRLLANRRFREIGALLLVLLIAAPQVMLQRGAGVQNVSVLLRLSPPWTLWGAAAEMALARPRSALLWLVLWTGALWALARWQFARSLAFDEQAAGSTVAHANPSHRRRWQELFYTLPSRLLPDPLAVLVEKELRTLSRSARFRLLLVMGFSFGLLIWLPMLHGSPEDSWSGRHYLTLVSCYSLLLLSEPLVWNCFGFDRAAAQVYFTLPIAPRTVLLAKNVSALVWLLIEFFLVALVCAAVGMPSGLGQIVEAVLVVSILLLSLLAFGNILSVRHARAVDPSQSWRNSAAGATQALLLLVYPLMALPIGLAYLAGYAWESSAIFYLVLAANGVFALVLYLVGLDSALRRLRAGQEHFLATLSQGGGPISS